MKSEFEQQHMKSNQKSPFSKAPFQQENSQRPRSKSPIEHSKTLSSNHKVRIDCVTHIKCIRRLI